MAAGSIITLYVRIMATASELDELYEKAEQLGLSRLLQEDLKKTAAILREAVEEDDEELLKIHEKLWRR